MNSDGRNTRTEHDSMGEIEVPADRYWGAQTERSRRNFRIGVGAEVMPEGIIRALAQIKLAAVRVNARLLPDRMSARKAAAIGQACSEIITGRLDGNFPLVVFQTGSGTQTNMNVNEVIANRANEIAGCRLCHPNDDVNMSQSSNDVFPTALHVAAIRAIETGLLPAGAALAATLRRIAAENRDAVKVGRTHLQDATPMTFGQEAGGWAASIETDLGILRASLTPLRAIALGGTAVGTGLNCPEGFAEAAAAELSAVCGTTLSSAPDKFHALSSKGELCAAHGAVKTLACDMMKIANDVRWLASGPRCGIGEISIPANEPGSSIMPGKVNPTQCEAVTMVAAQILGNDATLAVAAASGNFELNVFMPVIAYDFLQSCRLLTDAIVSFDKNCAAGIIADRAKMREELDRSLMTVTALTPAIGYENAARVAKRALAENVTLREACLSLGYLDGETFDRVFVPEKMVGKLPDGEN